MAEVQMEYLRSIIEDWTDKTLLMLDIFFQSDDKEAVAGDLHFL